MAVIYARISEDEAGEALGVGRQEKLCRTHAKKLGVAVSHVYVDNNVSASKRKPRPEFERLMDAMAAGEVDAVIVYHVDRLYRRNADLERIVDIVERHAVAVHTVEAGDLDLRTASGRMIARMLGAAAQHEVERNSERAKRKHDELAASGAPPGGRPPFGYSTGYVVNESEAVALRLMADRVLEGASLLRIAREMDAAGITTREGRPWHHSTVRAVLVNPAVAGLRVHRREVAGPGTWTPVLERDRWERVRAVLSDPSRKRKSSARKYLYTGLVVSSGGDAMVGATIGGVRYYRTPYPSKVPAQVNADAMEAMVEPILVEYLRRFSLPAVDPPTSPNVAEIERELKALADLRGRNVISMEEWLAARGPLQERLAVARSAAGAPVSVKLLERPGAAAQTWPSLSFDQRREVALAVVDRIVVGPASRGRWTALEERLDPDAGFGVWWRF